jgi:beta-lactamase class A
LAPAGVLSRIDVGDRPSGHAPSSLLLARAGEADRRTVEDRTGGTASAGAAIVRRVRARAALPLVAAALAASAPPALAGDAGLRASVDRGLPAVDRAAAALSAGDPDSVQALYDAARDLSEAVARAAPVGVACRPLRSAAGRYASARVAQAEGIDRLDPARSGAAGGRARSARLALAGARPRCRGDARPPAPAPQALSPGAGEAFFGAVVARAPAGADAARILLDGAVVAEPPVSGGRVRAAVSAAPGRHDLEVRFLTAGGDAGRARAPGVWLLPAAARAARPGGRLDAALSAGLAAAARASGAQAALWTQDLRSGAAAGWNADARFPAASTVKLGLLVGALGRVGPGPTALRYDLAAMTTWSSNLATNRLIDRLGDGATLAQGTLARLGARSSTFPGGYIVGTELQPALPSAGAPDPPPLVSRRVTTARDLARVLFAIHAAAAGSAQARRETGLTVRAARVALGWLLASEQAGDNVSLVAGGLPAGTPVAQKNGWLNAARHGAALVYDGAGPRIVVVMTYRGSGVARSRAAALGARAARLAAAGALPEAGAAP